MIRFNPKFQALALREAIGVDRVGNSRHAAVLALGSEIISIGHNKKKTHPLQLKFARNPEAIFLHAEIDAIAKAAAHLSLTDWKRCAIYVARAYADGRPAPSCPCPGCQSAIVAFNLGKVYHT